PAVVAAIPPVLAALPSVLIPIVIVVAGPRGHWLHADERRQQHADDSRLDTVHVDSPPDGHRVTAGLIGKCYAGRRMQDWPALVRRAGTRWRGSTPAVDSRTLRSSRCAEVSGLCGRLHRASRARSG